MTRKESGAKVRGTCKDGHVTEVVAGPRRITATVPCSFEGCERTVRCKRIPASESGEPSEKKEEPASKRGPKVTRVSGYERSGGGDAGMGNKGASDASSGKSGTGSGPTETVPSFAKRERPDDGQDDDGGIFPEW
jgi:hypothetical protein